ncbi:MAG: hypothetical protein M3Y87_10570 [Myxococcota bacterium]|nr:hypothetical protein [Myxococcota bacterium]
MSRDPYRRPELPRAEKPRGTIVRRAPEPDEIDREEHERTQARYRAQSARVQAELESAVREGAVRSRAFGGLLLAIGGFLSWASADGVGLYHSRSLFMAGGSLFAGAWLLVVGAGGGVDMQQAPLWVKVGTAVTFLIGGLIGVTGSV